MKKPNRASLALWFLTVPQAVFSLLTAYNLFTGYTTELFCLLIVSVISNVMFTAYAFRRSAKKSYLLKFYILMAVAYIAMAAAAMQLLGGSALSGWIISIRLVAILMCAVTLLYSLFRLAVVTEKGDVVNYLIGLALLPFVFYIAFNVANGINVNTAVMAIIIACAYTAIFLIIKAIIFRSPTVMHVVKPEKKLTKYYIIFSITLPLIGLMLNDLMDNFFGDFSDPAFFIIAIINGILVLTPPFEDRRLRLLKFFLTSAALLYFIYFFIVFLPYIPLGLMGLIYIVGILLFAPIGALIMQLVYLVREWREVAKLWDIKRTIIVFTIGLLLLPACVLTSFIGDRSNLETALSYVGEGTAKPSSEVDIGRLHRALNNAGSVYEFDAFVRGVEIAKNTPIISSIYSSLVLGGAVIPEGEMKAMNMIFFDSSNEDMTEELQTNTDVRITKITTDTSYDKEACAYRTWVNLTLQGKADETNSEFVDYFYLPEGAFITNYYLDVSGSRKIGLLADDRAATEVYKNIVRVKRDPGLLHYAEDGSIELRVFPFSGSEIRRTGFEVLHGQPCSFTIGGNTVELPVDNERSEVAVGGAVLISAKYKETLPTLESRPQEYYFIVDASEGSDIAYQVSQIREYAQLNGIGSAKVMLVSYRVFETDLDGIENCDIKTECGFNLALGVRTVLSENGDKTVPVIIFTTGNIYGAYLPSQISATAKRYPEISCYYELNDDMTLTPYEYENNEKQAPVLKPALGKILSYYGIPVKDDGQNELVFTGKTTDLVISGKQYEDAIKLEAAAGNIKPLDLIRASFRAHVLTPSTAFIVVETKAQEKELLEAQENILEADAYSDARITLDEPPLIIYLAIAALGIAVIVVVKRWRCKTKEQ